MNDYISLAWIESECRRIAWIMAPRGSVTVECSAYSAFHVLALPDYKNAKVYKLFRDAPVPELLRQAEAYAREVAVQNNAGNIEFDSWEVAA